MHGALEFLQMQVPADAQFYSERARCLLRLGVVLEDECPNYSSHFFNPKTFENTTPSAWIMCPLNDPDFHQQTAAERGRDHWNAAVADYRRGDYDNAFLNLGAVLHLLQDMTAPAHVHNDVHAKLGLATCQDGDDFENWGWSDCPLYGFAHIYDYIGRTNQLDPVCSVRLRDTDRYVLRFGGIQGPLAAGLATIFGNQPQHATRFDNENAGYAFIRELADKVYDFSSFHVNLKDTSSLQNDRGAGELKRMFPSLIEDGTGWLIDNLGWSAGDCGNVENQGWWLMDDASCQTDGCGFGCKNVSGFTYIENTGGGDWQGNTIPDNLYPNVYEKEWFKRRYGSFDNTSPNRNTMLRIYGDVLYAAAVAYGAGLLQAFLDEVLPRPIANAGGFYQGEACQPITFDASRSSDPNGTIVKFEWDFDNDGHFDFVTNSPLATVTYAQPYSDVAVLQVTDNDGRTDTDVAEVEIRPDMTSPVITRVAANPSEVWPPNRKMTPVTVNVAVSDSCASTSCRIISITSNEPVNGLGDGDTAPDWRITGALTANCRAERSGKGSGRVYTIQVQCTDAVGNTATSSVNVSVPYSHGGGKINSPAPEEQKPKTFAVSPVPGPKKSKDN